MISRPRACWVEITDDGRFLFTVNTASGSISRYSIAPSGALTLLGSTPVGATGGVGAVDARLSPDGRMLYVDESRIGSVGAFSVNDGNLSELASSPTSLPVRRQARRHRRQLTSPQDPPPLEPHELGARTPPARAGHPILTTRPVSDNNPKQHVVIGITAPSLRRPSHYQAASAHSTINPGGTMSTPYAFVARIEAKPEKAEEVAALLIGALPLAEAEPGTVDWYAARTSPTTFWIFDTFGSEDARQAHINGEIAGRVDGQSRRTSRHRARDPRRRRACQQIELLPAGGRGPAESGRESLGQLR